MNEKLYVQMKKKASEACYWKEEAIDKDDFIKAHDWRIVEAIWNEAAEMITK